MMMAITLRRAFSLALEVAIFGVATALAAEPPLFESRQITPAGEYTFNIEGPAVDARGDLYVVNFRKPGTIGILRSSASVSELFTELPEGSVGNAIRFDRAGRMFIADWKKHNVFLIEPGQTRPVVYFRSDQFNQPNDLTVAADGTLYVGESETREIWAYRIEGTRLVDGRMLRKFGDLDIDGLRTDVDGRLYVVRILKGTIAVLSPDGKLLREIPVTAKEPTNLAFGGPDGRTVFVTQRKGGFIETFRVDRPGREFCLHETASRNCLKAP